MPNSFLVFVLVLGLTSSDIHAYSGDGATEDMATLGKREMPDESFGLDETNDSNLSEESDDEMSTDTEDEIHDESLPEEVMAEQDLSPRAIRKIRRVARRLAQGRCGRAFSLARYQGKKRSFISHYQAHQHGQRSPISDEEWTRAKKSEDCSSCVLNKLCRMKSVQSTLGIRPWAFRDWRRNQRICKRNIRRHALDLDRVQAKKITCNSGAIFRTIDGTCNNLENPSLGAAGTQFNRLLPADYGDSVSTPRLASNCKELPNARGVSLLVHGSNANRNNPNSSTLTHLAMNFGQFMDHDTTLALFKEMDCEPPTSNPECVNIEIPKDDAKFRERHVEVIELERDCPHLPASFCNMAPREHTNNITSYIDASQIYGSSKDRAESLRAPGPDGAFLKVMKHPDHKRDLLPREDREDCASLDPNRPCFLSGDIRNNENPGLNSVHTIFVREHNRIAKELTDDNNNGWDAERIYQETRKIIGAQLQVITYKEFLPLVLSENMIKEFDLKLLEGTQFFNGYDKSVNAQMTTGFSVAAYRFGHSLVQEVFERFNQNAFEGKEKTELRRIPVLDFNNPQYLYETCQGGIDAILRGLIKDPAAKADGLFSSSVQENLRRNPRDLSDLISINIQRGRERGVPAYTKYRNIRNSGLPKICELQEVKSFSDLVTVAGFAKKDVEKLKKVYNSVNDIDLFVGGMLEPRPTDGGVLGPTFQCIIAEQFRRLRLGDRFWHENAKGPAAYNAAMLQEIRKTTLAKIICDNSDGITAINPNVLKQSNEREKCSSLPSVSLSPWTTPHKDAGASDDLIDDPGYLDDDDIAV